MNNLPTVTKNLLIINVLCFFGMLVAKPVSYTHLTLPTIA